MPAILALLSSLDGPDLLLWMLQGLQILREAEQPPA